MKTVLMAVMFATGFASVVSAQSIGGSYQASGKNFDGSNYFGRAEITVTSNTTCRISWVIARTTWRGICMRNGTSFSASYTSGNAIGLVIYELKPDGTLEGLWTLADKPGVGTETLTPVR
jgi:hypothetical protein